MTGKRNFAARPGDAERWVKAPGPKAGHDTDAFTARLTIDVTPALRGRIKIAAFTRGVTVADLLRDLLEQHFPETEERQP